MKIALLGAPGVVGQSAAANLAGRPEVQELLLVDYDIRKAKRLAKSLSPRCRWAMSDVGRAADLGRLIPGLDAVASPGGPWGRAPAPPGPPGDRRRLPEGRRGRRLRLRNAAGMDGSAGGPFSPRGNGGRSRGSGPEDPAVPLLFPRSFRRICLLPPDRPGGGGARGSPPRRFARGLVRNRPRGSPRH